MSHPSRGVARIGVFVPYTNCNLEADMALLAPRGVSFHYARLGDYDIEEVPDEGQMARLGASDMSEPLRLLLGVRPDAVMYGCTSATLTHGPEFDATLATSIRDRAGAATVTAAGALVHALGALGARRIGFASPYVGAINDMAVDFFARSGVQTIARADIGRDLGNYGQGELTPDEVFELAARVDREGVEAIVLSCTDMRSVEVIARLEAATGRPVVTSNQAMLYQVMGLLGLDRGRVPGGRLFAAEKAA